MTVDHTTEQGVPGFAHTALIIDADLDLSSVLGTELCRSAEIYDEVLLVVSDRTRAALAGTDVPGEMLSWGDPAAFYQRLGSAYEAFRRYLAGRHQAGRRVHVIAEPDLISAAEPEFRAERAEAYLAYEAVCNDAYVLGGSAVTCIWDSRDHGDTVINAVRATHSSLLTAAGPVPSQYYLSPERYLTERHETPSRPAPPRADHDVTLSEVAQLSGLRSMLGAWTAEHGFTRQATEDVLVAVVEVATNGLRYGGAQSGSAPGATAAH
jgi:hypothetical protein